MFSQFDDSLKNMHNRIFFLWIGLCLVANTIGTIFNYYALGWTSVTKLCAFIGLIMIAVVIISLLVKRKEIASVVIFLLLTWLEFPALYMVHGRIAIAYLILSIFAGTIVFPLKWYFAFASTSVIWYGLVILYESIDEPMVIIVYNQMTYFIAAIAVIAIQGGLLYYYEKQKQQLSIAKSEIEYVAKHDALTGLYNRGFLMDSLGQMMSDRERFTFVLIDIDNFKSVNDNYGHQTGDDVLKKLGQEIINAIGDLSFSARYGGEEIAIIFKDKSEDECRRILLHIRNVVNKYFEEVGVKVTFSGGISNSWEHESVKSLISCADKNLYVAKNLGKDKVI